MPHSSRFQLDELPTFLGGTCQCSGGCVMGLANDQKEFNLEVSILRQTGNGYDALLTAPPFSGKGGG